MSKINNYFIIVHFIVLGNVKVVNSDNVHLMVFLRLIFFTISIGGMAMQSTVTLKTIPHFDTNEFWYAYVSHNYHFEKHVFIQRSSTSSLIFDH